MGCADLIDEIFEIIGKEEEKLSLYLVHDGGKFKRRILSLDGGEASDIEITKLMAKKIVKELIEEFKLNSEGIFPPKPKVMGIQNAKII